MKVKILNSSPFPLPAYKTVGSAGMDLQAHIEEPIQLASMERCIVPTGLRIELPLGYEAQVRARSGLSIKKGLTLINAIGTIDADYRGEIGVLMINLSTETQTIEAGERIAQLVIKRYEQIEWEAVDELSDTQRGEGGFGSTGT